MSIASLLPIPTALPPPAAPPPPPPPPILANANVQATAAAERAAAASAGGAGFGGTIETSPQGDQSKTETVGGGKAALGT